MNAFPQPGASHGKGRSPVWVRRCLVRSLFRPNSFPQWSHACVRAFLALPPTERARAVKAASSNSGAPSEPTSSPSGTDGILPPDVLEVPPVPAASGKASSTSSSSSSTRSFFSRGGGLFFDCYREQSVRTARSDGGPLVLRFIALYDA